MKPIKQRTLGRGEIKPYEIVDLVDMGKQGSEEEKPSRMESMYVETFGAKSSSLDRDGYQTITEYSEPHIEDDAELESNEFDLSDLDKQKSNSEQTDNGELESTNETQDVEHARRDLHAGTLSSVHLELNDSFHGSSLSTSLYSDGGDGWDSDEFAYYTDDDVLEETKPRAKVCLVLLSIFLH